MNQIIKLVEENNNFSSEIKKIFMQLWEALKEDQKQELEKVFSEKPQMLENLLNIIDQKKQAVENLNPSLFNDIINQEKDFLSQL